MPCCSRSRARPTRSFSLPAVSHFDPVQFLFHLMKRIIADLVAGTHGENSLTRRVKGVSMNVAMKGSSGFSFLRVAIPGSQMRDEFLPYRLCDWRSVVF